MAIYDYQGNIVDSGGGGAVYNWSSRKITFEGDSITKNVGYPSYVCNLLGATENNIAVPGIPVFPLYESGANIERDFRSRVSNIPSDTDCIVIIGDTNATDSGMVASDTEIFSTSVSSWSGRWNLALNGIKKSFPTVPVILCSCFRQGTKETQAKYVAHAFERMAEHYGCLFMDLSTQTALNLLYSSPVWGLTATDTVHPNAAGMPLFAKPIADFIQKIKPFSFAGSSTLNIDSSITVAKGSTADIGYTITGDLSIRWQTSNASIAQVLGGTVYGMSAGNATITATMRDGSAASCSVTVTN